MYFYCLDILGRAFSFVQSDILSKAKIVESYGEKFRPEKGKWFVCVVRVNSKHRSRLSARNHRSGTG